MPGRWRCPGGAGWRDWQPLPEVAALIRATRVTQHPISQRVLPLLWRGIPLFWIFMQRIYANSTICVWPLKCFQAERMQRREHMSGSSFPEPVEDILAHIPCSRVLEYKTGDVIYGESEPVGSIFLVIAGVVKVSRHSAAGQETIVDIYHTDDFLGLTAFLDKPSRTERATSLKTAQVMKWSIGEIKEIISKQPRLGIALLQMVIQRTVDFEHRVKSYSLDTIPCRLARSLLYLAGRFGTQARDGSVLITPFTHL